MAKTQLRGFLRLTRYYRKFVRNYGALTRPLTNLFKKGQFRWSEEAKNAFEKLKNALLETLKLSLLDFSEPFMIEIDALGNRSGAILTQ